MAARKGIDISGDRVVSINAICLFKKIYVLCILKNEKIGQNCILCCF